MDKPTKPPALPQADATAVLEPITTSPAIGCSYRATPDSPPCDLPIRSLGLCNRHYTQAYRKGLTPKRGVSSLTASIASTKAAKEQLACDAVEYAKMHLTGARVAARKGDTRPAEWALLHSRAVDPVSKEAGELGPRVTVNVGVALPGLGTSVSVTNSRQPNPSDPELT